MIIEFNDLLQNTAVASPGESGRQAVALRISGDKAMFYKVKVVGSQDTLLDETGLHYFYRSYIQGTVDFIFGNSRSLYQVITYFRIVKFPLRLPDFLHNYDTQDRFFETGLFDSVHC